MAPLFFVWFFELFSFKGVEMFFFEGIMKGDEFTFRIEIRRKKNLEKISEENFKNKISKIFFWKKKARDSWDPTKRFLPKWKFDFEKGIFWTKQKKINMKIYWKKFFQTHWSEVMYKNSLKNNELGIKRRICVKTNKIQNCAFTIFSWLK